MKSVRQIIKTPEVQFVNYLVAAAKPVGLILNLAKEKLKLSIGSGIYSN
jgi:hypothetical protein